jgi:hypothetical protein
VQITDPSNALLYALDIAPDGTNSYRSCQPTTVDGCASSRRRGHRLLFASCRRDGRLLTVGLL